MWQSRGDDAKSDGMLLLVLCNSICDQRFDHAENDLGLCRGSGRIVGPRGAPFLDSRKINPAPKSFAIGGLINREPLFRKNEGGGLAEILVREIVAHQSGGLRAADGVKGPLV